MAEEQGSGQGPGFTLVDPPEGGREKTGGDEGPGGSGGAPPIDFSTFVLSLATTALIELGLAPDPQTGERREPDRALARQTIDSLAMLREKTRGNLDEAEQKLLEGLITDLRLRYVQVREESSG